MDEFNELDMIRAAQGKPPFSVESMYRCRGRLVEKWSPLLWKLAHRYSPPHADPRDFYHGAVVAFLEAVDGFKEKKGAKPITYFYRCVWGKLVIQCKSASVVFVPRGSDFGSEEVQAAQRPISLDLELGPFDSNGSRLLDVTDDFELVAYASARTDLYDAINRMPSRLSKVILLRLRGLTLRAIGRRMRVFHTRVSQLEREAWRILKADLSERWGIDKAA